MAELAAAMAVAGRFADVVRLATGNPLAARRILLSALPNGRLAEAEDCLRVIAAGRPPPTALVALAQAHHNADDQATARRLAREAADLITDRWSNDVVEVVMVLRAVGERDRAAAVVDALIAESTPRALRLLARIYARTDEPEIALATARRSRELEPQPVLDNAVAGDIAEALERDGHADWADAAADTVEDNLDRNRIRRRQIQAAAAAGAIDRAVALAALDIGYDVAGDAISDLVARLVSKGRTETALRLARGRKGVGWAALARVAVAIAEEGKAAWAEEVAAEIPDSWGARARRDVAATIARCGDHTLARAVADRIAVDHIRGMAYGDLAIALVDSGRHTEARRTMAEALCAAAWPDVVVPLGMVEPDAVHVLADTVLATPNKT